MASAINKIDKYVINKKDTFILDTNVLIKLFYPAMGINNDSSYISFFKMIKKNNCRVLISTIQISEFVNRCIRFQFDLYKKDHSEIEDFKKHYRETEDYRNCMDAIIEIIEDMLSQFQKINDNFQDICDEDLTKKVYAYDFNDSLIAMICKRTSSVLVTDDKDYINFVNDISIVTNNRQLLLFKNRH